MALLSLYRYNFTSHIVWENYSLIRQLAEGNCVTLYWVPSYSGKVDNEVADEMALLSPMLIQSQPLGYRVILLGILSDIF